MCPREKWKERNWKKKIIDNSLKEIEGKVIEINMASWKQRKNKVFFFLSWGKK